MGFLSNLVEELTHKNENQGYSGQQTQGYPQGGPAGDDLPYPWRKEWDQRDQRWIFVNSQTGQTSFEHPMTPRQNPSYSQQGYPQQGYPPQGYSQQSYPPAAAQQQQQSSHSGLKYGALGAAGGLAAGALAMHEGEEMKQDFNRMEDNFADDRQRFDQRVEDIPQEIEDVPEDVAGDIGEGVGRVEGFGDRIEDDVEDIPQDIEDVPGDIAGDIGEGVGRVERFGDNMDDAYDAGRDDERDDY